MSTYRNRLNSLLRLWLDGTVVNNDSISFAVLFRQFVERDNSNDYWLLRFVCDWVVHVELNRRSASTFVRIYMREIDKYDEGSGDLRWFWREFDRELYKLMCTLGLGQPSFINSRAYNMVLSDLTVNLNNKRVMLDSRIESMEKSERKTYKINKYPNSLLLVSSAIVIRERLGFVPIDGYVLKFNAFLENADEPSFVVIDFLPDPCPDCGRRFLQCSLGVQGSERLGCGRAAPEH